MMLQSIIPLPYRILAISLLAVTLISYGWIHGANHVQDEWAAATAETKIVIARRQQKQAEITTQIVTQYVDRVKVVKERGEEIIKEVPVYVPNDSCVLPGGFRVFHDADARNVLPDATGIADAAAVPAQDVAETIARNYKQYYECAEQLMALQDWVRKQNEVQ